MYGLVYIFSLYVAYTCACAGGGSGVDNQIYTNPSFMLMFNPPAAWTYPSSTAETLLAYFPGQPLTQTEAQTNAIGALKSAMLSALSESNINTVGLEVTPSFTAPQVPNCNKVMTPLAAGAMFGIYEAGAITRLATVGSAGVPIANCISGDFSPANTISGYQPFIQQASIKVSGFTASGYQLRQIANALMSLLNFNNHVIFTQEITYS